MSQVVTRTSGLIASLTQELTAVDWEIDQLVAYRTGVQQLLALLGGLHEKVALVSTPHRLRAVVVTQTIEAPMPDLPADTPSTLEMARTVLRNAGTPMTLSAVRTAIRSTYGVEPAKTLDQMLYKRAQQSKGFYKTSTGQFGLLPVPAGLGRSAIVTPLAVPTTALV